MTCRCNTCREAPTPLERGDAHGVVIRLSLDLHGLQWLVGELDTPGNERDLAVVELREALTDVEAAIADREQPA